MEDYTEISVVSKGSFRTVILCERKCDRKKVILKKIPICVENSGEVQDVRNEILILSSVDHTNIIKYYNSFTLNDSDVVIVMEYATNGTLYDYVKRQNNLLQQKVVTIMFAQLCLAIDYLHVKNIIHRDITAANVLLAGIIVKLSDFGISKDLNSRRRSIDDLVALSSSSSSLTTAGLELMNSRNLIGTLQYMAPETCFGQPYTKESDIWSLGCLLYFLVTRRLPFTGSNHLALVRKITNDLPDLSILDLTVYEKDIVEIMCSLLNKDPSKRLKIEAIKTHPFMLRHIINIGTDLPFITF